MIIAFRNFFRNKMVNLSVKSIRHFLPDCRIIVCCLYKESPEDYNDQEPLDPSVEVLFFKTKYSTPTKPLDAADSKTSGFQSGENALFFTEGYNCIFEVLKDCDEKVLMLAEDHFFTTGEVINELTSNDFDLAYAKWDREEDANGSILGVRFSRLKNYFPMEEKRTTIEKFLENTLVKNISPDRRYVIKNRVHSNYFNDGMYTNSSLDMINKLKECNII